MGKCDKAEVNMFYIQIYCTHAASLSGLPLICYIRLNITIGSSFQTAYLYV